MIKPKHILLLFLSICLIPRAQATHQRSGEITYRHISGLTYEFTITTYTFAPSPADRWELEILYGDGGSAILPRVNGLYGLHPSGNYGYLGEIVDAFGLIRKNVYTGQHTYAGSSTYTISVEDPNRNAGIINIPNSVDVPFFVQSTLVINPFLGSPNNSVQLLLPPIDNACVGHTFIHNTGAWDPDGDSLSFQIVTCRGFNGLPIPGYTLPTASDSIFINPVNGDLIWETPVMQGEYNIAIEVTEWRNGIVVGKVTRDLQIIVGSCENNPHPPVIHTITDTCVVAGTTLYFPVRATDADGHVITLTGVGEPLTLEYKPANFTQPVDSAGMVTSYFLWAAQCSHVRKIPYVMYFKAQDNGMPVNLIDIHKTTITVIGPPPKNLTANASGNNILLNWERSSCTNITGYRIYRKIGQSDFIPGNCITGVPDWTGFQLISGANPISDTLFIDDGQDQPLIHGLKYCYLVTAIFPDSSESYASNQACSSLKKDIPIITHASVLNTSAIDGAVYVAWSKPTELDFNQAPGPFKYLINREVDGQSMIVDSLSHLNDTVFIDSGLNTIQNPYSYKIDLINDTPGNRFLVGSSFKATSIFLDIEPNDKRLNLSWNIDVPWINSYYVIYRLNMETSQFDSIGVSYMNNYTDSGLTNGFNYCYKVMSSGNYLIDGLVNPIINFSQEKCAIPVDYSPPCPPELFVETDCDLLINTLRWTNTDNYCPYTDDTDKYYIWYRQQSVGDFILLDSTLIATDTVYDHYMSIGIAGCYAVTAIDFNGNISSPSNIVCISSDACPLYSLPNVFTPNNDSYNDYWEAFPHLASVERIKLVVVNRWGNLVFETTDPNFRWDGRNISTNKLCPDGAYFYVCDVFEITLEGTRQRTITGSVHIITGK